MDTQYLSLTEYSSKYRVSISTLRRKIKTDDIKFVFENGKYLIEDSPMSAPRGPRVATASGLDERLHEKLHQEPREESREESHSEGSEPVLHVANRLLTELKKAYSQILHEKEEQILYLKEELLDLRTLVRVLESENERLSQRKN